MNFAIDWVTFTILFILIPCLWWTKSRFFPSKPVTPSFGYSQIDPLLKKTSRRLHLLPIPRYLYLSSLFFFLIAWIDPHFQSINTSNNSLPSSIPVEGVALYLVLDQSGSMSQRVTLSTLDGSRAALPKIDILKDVTRSFIQQHPNDLIGLISFARVPKVMVPLTSDQNQLLNQLQNLQVVSNPDQDGTAMGYAIYKAVSLIAATKHYMNDHSSYEIKSGLVIVVTDGIQDPSRLDRGNRLRTMEIDDAAQIAKEHQVRLYIVNIDPSFGGSAYAPHRRQMETLTKSTGGAFYLLDDQKDLQKIYSDIDVLEKGKVLSSNKVIDHFRTLSLYPYLIGFGLASFIIACILECLYFRVFP